MTSIATYSYSIAALAFLLLSLFLVTSSRGRRHAGMLAAASMLTVLWSAVLAWQAAGGTVSPILIGTVDLLRSGGWTAFLIVMTGDLRKSGSPLPFQLRPSLALIIGAYLLLLAVTATGEWSNQFLNSLGVIPGVTARVGLAVLGMLLVEQLYRNSREQGRWAIKFACLGVGAIFVYDFYMYSDAMLFHEINRDIWAARGVVNALTAPLIAIAVSRSAAWSAELAVSRRAAFHSAALIGSAIYLLAMGSAGYYLRYVGGRWGTVMQVTFLFGALILLGSMLFSGAMRSWLKVFISKHFYSYNYDYREEWLRFTRTLSEHGPGLGDRTIEALAGLVESPGGALWLCRDSSIYRPSANWQAPPIAHAEPADSLFCQFLETRQWVIDLHELRDNPEKYAGFAIPEWLAQVGRARLVVPLIMHGKLFGFMLLLQPRSAIKLNWEVIDLLKVAGSQAASYLAQFEAANALMVARQFESFNRMSTFVVHDLKNLVSQLSLLTLNAQRHKSNPEFQQDMIETVNFSVQKMKLLLQRLSRSAAPEQPRALLIERLVRQAVALKAEFNPKPVLTVTDPGLTVLADWERLERVVGHLIQNAIEATARDGRVDIELARRGDKVMIQIADTGAGMSEQFIRERLFKPFETTKSAGIGIGAFESFEYIQELGGTLEVRSEPSRGSTFRIILPVVQLKQQATPTIHQAA